MKAWGLIDTGADSCAFPAYFANYIGDDLLKGQEREIHTGNGNTEAYSHATKINIFEIKGNDMNFSKIVYTIAETQIDFMLNLNNVLLGVREFLSDFTLYNQLPPSKIFNP